MPDFNKERIFNESPKKVLIREYDNLKADYNKLNALKYKQVYSNNNLSFILENSPYIYKEMYFGSDFIIDILNRFPIPFQMLSAIHWNILEYVNNTIQNENISEQQKSELENMRNQIDQRVAKEQNSIRLYNEIMEHSEFLNHYYDAAYRYINNHNETDLEYLRVWLQNNENMYLMDVINIILDIPELHSELYVYLKKNYETEPDNENDYRLNSTMVNILSRMVTDSYFKEKIDSLTNTNLRYLIYTIAGVEEVDVIESILVSEKSSNDIIYSTAYNAINSVYDSEVYDEAYRDNNNIEKYNRLLCEKAVIDTSLSFLLLDNFSNDNAIRRNSIVEKVCIENGNISNIPKDIERQIEILEKVSNDLQKDINSIFNEKYFKPDGSMGDVVAKIIGSEAKDSIFSQKKKNSSVDNELDKDEKENDSDNYYTPVKKRDSNISDKNAKQTDKYANMSLDTDEFNSIFKESNLYLENDDISEMIKNAKPEKKNIFRRIQNKALDTNVKFKKRLANSKRQFVDVKNAGKAVAKIPNNVSTAVKKQVEEWDELDDNKRKEYIMKRGFRKKYFKALRLVISHYIAFLINPVLNVVLAIVHHYSKETDERIKNELVRELKAEIKVTEEKIEDAKSRDDKEAKYKLMRIKEKLDAEVIRISTNSKYV